MILFFGIVILAFISFPLSVRGAAVGMAVSNPADTDDGAVSLPLKIDAHGRYLVDQHNVPFLIQGDSPWSLIVGLTNDEVEQYLEVRKRQGFNAILVNLIEHHFPGAQNKKGAPFNRDGQEPFRVSGDFTTPNEAYFAHADWVLRRAGELGFVVFLTPCYLGYPGTEEGWYKEVKASKLESCRDYGRYLGKRYGGLNNIIWVAGGDHNPDDVRAQVLALVAGLRETNASQLWTAHCVRENSAADQYGNQPWLTINSSYAGTDVAEKCLQDFLREPVRPTFLLEAYYENEPHGNQGPMTADDSRKQAWLAALSGTCGQFFGNRPVWLFEKGWFSALYSLGARYQIYLRKCLLSRHWEKLVPETSQRLLPEGLGNGPNRKAAAVTSDKSTALIYLPVGGQITVELPLLEGPQVQSWWFSPRDGSSRSAGKFATGDRYTFSTPDSGDWVLVLDSVSRDATPPAARNIFSDSTTAKVTSP
jgi:Protein of unknown function (DUF4038)/Putative collagen-binding domain of a collagenase